MGAVWTNVELRMPTETDYKVVEVFIKKFFDDEAHWPVKDYDKDNLSITIKEVLADEDDVIGFAKVLSKLLCEYAASQDDAEFRETIEMVSYAMYGETIFANCGEQIDYIIEKKNKQITVSETEHYTFFGCSFFDDYEEFCEIVESICPDVQEIIDEDEYDSDCEYSVTYTNVYVDETPEYGTPYPIEDYKKFGKIYSTNDEIIAYLKENNLPYDDETIANLSIDDVYAILAGTYGKGTSDTTVPTSCPINFKGKIFVLTGFNIRTEMVLTDVITANGGEIKSATVLKTDYLIYDEREGRETAKHRRAEELIDMGYNIKMIPGRQFLQMIGK